MYNKGKTTCFSRGVATLYKTFYEGDVNRYAGNNTSLKCVKNCAVPKVRCSEGLNRKPNSILTLTVLNLDLLSLTVNLTLPNPKPNHINPDPNSNAITFGIVDLRNSEPVPFQDVFDC